MVPPSPPLHLEEEAVAAVPWGVGGRVPLPSSAVDKEGRVSVGGVCVYVGVWVGGWVGGWVCLQRVVCI